MTRFLRLLLVPALLAGLAAAVFLFLAVRPLAVAVVRPAEEVAVEVFGLGSVEARVLSEIGFEVGGALRELHADHGDRVRAGEILARLHAAEQEARLAKAAAGVARAEAALAKAEAAAGRARAVLARARETNRRKQALLAKKAISVDSAEKAQMDEDVAAAELAVARSEIEVARAALEDAEAQYRYEKIVLDHHTLAAPYEAIVVARRKELGAVLKAGEPLFTLVAPETVWVRAYVDEARAGGIRVGQPARIRLRSLPRETFRGRVARIDIESDRVSEERRIYVTCEDCPERFHLGEQAEVFVTVARLERALLVPEIAVENFDGGHGTVWTVEDGVLRRREVSFGHRTLDARLEILSGLPEGARVLASLPSGLREGRAASVVAEEAP